MPDPIRVLIADDEREFALALARVLKRRGLEVEVVYAGDEALRALGRADFDVVVLDLCMPGMDGVTTLQNIRSRDRLTKVVLLSGKAEVGDVSEALRSGADDFLLKPCAVETLVSVIEDAAERKAIDCELSSTTSENPRGAR